MVSELSSLVTRLLFDRTPEMHSHPFVSSGRVRCDLHVDPCIRDEDSLIDVFEAMVANNANLVAIATPGVSSEPTLNYDELRNNITCCWFADKEFRFSDHDYFFCVEYKKTPLAFARACTTNVEFTDSGCLMQFMALMPDAGFCGEVTDRMQLKDYLELAHRYDAVVIASQPFAIADPVLNGSKLKFEFANPDDIRLIVDKVFPVVDGVELLADSPFFIDTDILLAAHFPRRSVIHSSGVYANSGHSRMRIGTSGTEFDAESWYSPRDQLRGMIGNGDLTAYSVEKRIVERMVSELVGKVRGLL